MKVVNIVPTYCWQFFCKFFICWIGDIERQYIRLNGIVNNSIKQASDASNGKPHPAASAFRNGRRSLLTSRKMTPLEKMDAELMIKGIDPTNLHPDRALNIYSELCLNVLTLGSD